MDGHPNRRRFLRRSALGLGVVAGGSLAGCSDPDDGDDGGGGVYREDEVDPQAGISAGGSSAG